MPTTHDASLASLAKSLPEAPGVYRLVHRVTGDAYIGSSADMRKRFVAHLYCIINGRPINAAVGKVVKEYGLDFEASVLVLVSDRKERLRAERDLIRKFKPALNNRCPVSNRLLKGRRRENDLERINVILPASEREAFDKWCRYGHNSERVSMNLRIRQLLRADAAGRVPVPRTAEPAPKK